MGRRFRGEGLHKVDSKGRVSIPALFRRVIESCDPNWKEGLPPELIIVYGDERRKFIECYTIEAIEEVDSKIDNLPRGSQERKTLERFFHGQSIPTSIDETGRLVLSSKLRERFAIEKEAYFIAAGDTFQIWSPQIFEADQEETNNWLRQQPLDFDKKELADALASARKALLALQKKDGHWCFPLEADCTIPAEYVLMMHFMDDIDTDLEIKLARFIRSKQDKEHGGWPLYYDGHFDLSCTVKAYYALKLVGDSPEAPHMVAARTAILSHGGASKANVFTRSIFRRFLYTQNSGF